MYIKVLMNEVLDKLFEGHPELLDLSMNKSKEVVWKTVRALLLEQGELPKNARKSFFEYLEQLNAANQSIVAEITKSVKPKYDQIKSFRVHQNYQIDLFMLNEGMFGSKVKGFLTAIDVHSRFVWILPFVRKTGAAIAEVLELLFDDLDALPETVTTDEGSEFISKEVQALLRERNVKHIIQAVPSSITIEKHHVVLCERFHRELRKYILDIKLRHKGDILGHIQRYIDLYNNSLHSGINDIPSRVLSSGVRRGGDTARSKSREDVPMIPIGTVVRTQAFTTNKLHKKTIKWSVGTYTVTGHEGRYHILDNDDSVTYLARELKHTM